MVSPFRCLSALVKGYSTISSLLEKISDNDSENVKTRTECRGLAKKMKKLETGFVAGLWHRILERMNTTSKRVQDPKLDINNAVFLLTSLQEFISSLRSQFDSFERCGQELSGVNSYKPKRGRTSHLNEAESNDFVARENFRVESFFVIIDKLTVAMSDRIRAYTEVCQLFGFLAKLEQLDEQEIIPAAENLVSTYKNDLEESLTDELVQFSSLLRTPIVKQSCYSLKEEASKELNMFCLIVQHDLVSIFPNVEVVLRIYLSMMVSNCSGERTFSKLKRIKNEVRSTMGETRLNFLSIMSIESDILRDLDFSSIIETFACLKTRKVVV